MPRTDRLFDLIGLLRDGQLHRAQDLAGRLAVSTRTIWRDMDTLVASGLPVEGTRGHGYRLAAPIILPPLTLTETELEALHLGMAVVGEAADSELQAAARSLAAKVEALRPGQRGAPAAGWGIAAYPFAEAEKGFPHMPPLRAAIRDRRGLRITYRAPDGTIAEHRIRPLQMDYLARLWTLTAWCEDSADFALFRVDRIERMEPGPGFENEPGKTLADYHARYERGPDGN